LGNELDQQRDAARALRIRARPDRGPRTRRDVVPAGTPGRPRHADRGGHRGRRDRRARRHGSVERERARGARPVRERRWRRERDGRSRRLRRPQHEAPWTLRAGDAVAGLPAALRRRTVMAITRRQFLKRTGLMAAGTVLGPNLWRNPWVRDALASTIGDRYFVVLFLDGGNDSLNTLIPATNGAGTLRTAYEAARKTGNGGLQLSPSDLAATLVGTDPNTGAQLALHPGFTGLKALWDLDKVAIVQGCGYPEYSLSHDQARSIWQTGNPLGIGSLAGTGWMGRYLAANYGSLDIPGGRG